MPIEAPEKYPTEARRLRIQEAIDGNVSRLQSQGRLSLAAASPPLLGWPLVPVNGLRDPGYHVTYYFVDLDPNFPDQVLDYECGSRTYDDALGYNHQGTDYVAWPFRWTRFAGSQLAVVAAAPGTIVYKEDGNPDYDCTAARTLWNAVYVRHDDGSVAWYGHLENGSLTPKGVGDDVAQGEYLGLVGASGVTTGPHLHFEVHDANGDVVDPHEGPCNNVPSMWAHQRPYYDSAINRLATGPEPPIPFSACPGGEAPNEATDFAPGATVYFTAYYRDQRNLAQDPSGAVTQHAIYAPDGSLVLAWTHSSPADYYAGSFWTFDVQFPDTAEPGIYRWEAVYEGVTYEHFFSIGGPFASGAVPERSPEGTPLTATLEPGGDITLDWGPSCDADDTDYAIYEGILGDYYSHEALACSTNGQTTATFTPPAGSAYYLVVPDNKVWEGSYGSATGGVERPAAPFACLPQLTGRCRWGRLLPRARESRGGGQPVRKPSSLRHSRVK